MADMVTCKECGGWVSDPVRHIEWHTALRDTLEGTVNALEGLLRTVKTLAKAYPHAIVHDTGDTPLYAFTEVPREPKASDGTVVACDVIELHAPHPIKGHTEFTCLGVRWPE